MVSRMVRGERLVHRAHQKNNRTVVGALEDPVARQVVGNIESVSTRVPVGDGEAARAYQSPQRYRAID